MIQNIPPPDLARVLALRLNAEDIERLLHVMKRNNVTAFLDDWSYRRKGRSLAPDIRVRRCNTCFTTRKMRVLYLSTRLGTWCMLFVLDYELATLLVGTFRHWHYWSGSMMVKCASVCECATRSLVATSRFLSTKIMSWSSVVCPHRVMSDRT